MYRAIALLPKQNNKFLCGWKVEASNLARICKPFKEPKNRFPAWRAGTTTLFDVPARRQAT